jgi:hypothetical protein
VLPGCRRHCRWDSHWEQERQNHHSWTAITWKNQINYHGSHNKKTNTIKVIGWGDALSCISLIINNRSIKMFSKNCLALALFCLIHNEKMHDTDCIIAYELVYWLYRETQQNNMHNLRSNYQTQILII